MKKIIIKISYLFGIDIISSKIQSLIAYTKAYRISKIKGTPFKFIDQGSFDFDIMGPLSEFSIHETSHIKGGSYIECSGGVTIGKYFHTGRGLTIFSHNHNWRSNESLPYDETKILKPVIIGDAVWCGCNVTILPGVSIGDGVIIAAGTVVTENIKSGYIVGGNPGQIIGMRDQDTLNKLMNEKKFF